MMERSYESEAVSIRIPKHVLGRLLQLASAEYTTVPGYIRRVLIAHIQEIDRPSSPAVVSRVLADDEQ